MISSSKIVLLALLTFMTENFYCQESSGQGYPPFPDEASIKTIVDLLDKDLDLRNGQKRKIHKLYKRHFSAVKVSIASRKGQNSPDVDFRNQMHEMKIRFEVKVRCLLDEDQKKKFDSYLYNLRMHREHFFRSK